jgi:septation ring formation regulator EzrA
MMGLSQGAPGAAEVIAIAQRMAMPDAVKATLADIGQQLDALNKRREEIAALQKQVETDRAAADSLKARADEFAQDLVTREQKHSARVAKLDAVVAAFEQKLAAHEAALQE